MSQNRQDRADERESENPKFFHKNPVKKVRFLRESLAEEESLDAIKSFWDEPAPSQVDPISDNLGEIS